MVVGPWRTSQSGAFTKFLHTVQKVRMIGGGCWMDGRGLPCARAHKVPLAAACALLPQRGRQLCLCCLAWSTYGDSGVKGGVGIIIVGDIAAIDRGRALGTGRVKVKDVVDDGGLFDAGHQELGLAQPDLDVRRKLLDQVHGVFGRYFLILEHLDDVYSNGGGRAGDRRGPCTSE